MHPDPDDTDLIHSHFACKIPTWCAVTGIGRAYARRKITRIVQADLRDKGYTQESALCFHFGTVDGTATALAHFTTRDTIATAYAETDADR